MSRFIASMVVAVFVALVLSACADSKDQKHPP